MRNASIKSFFSVKSKPADSTAAAAATATPMSTEPSSYADLREATIRRNREFLLSLGLIDSSSTPALSFAPTTPQTRKRSLATTTTTPPPSMPQRRSKRLNPKKDIAEENGDNFNADDAGGDDASTIQDEPLLAFNASDVARYSIPVSSNALSYEQFENSAQLRGFVASNVGSLSARHLNRVYSVDFGLVNSHLFVATAGHQGYAALTAVAPVNLSADDDDDDDDDEDQRLLLEWRASRGWIGSVQFVSCDGKLLTVSNDSLVKLWDVSLVDDSNAPKLLAANDSLHSSGIFQAHCSRNSLFTASKDKSVALSSISDAGFTFVRRFEALHRACVKTVRARNDNVSVFASAGMDRCIAIGDVRGDSDAPSIAIRDAHQSPISSVVWHGDLLLSASYDTTLKLHDVRRADRVLFELPVPGGKAIVRPAFCNKGRNVVSGSDGMRLLSLFCTQSGSAVSRGVLEVDSCTVQCGAMDDALAERVNSVAVQQAPSIGGEAILIAAAGGAEVQVLCGDVGTAAAAEAEKEKCARAEEKAAEGQTKAGE
jgi:WD40 repeat protein